MRCAPVATRPIACPVVVCRGLLDSPFERQIRSLEWTVSLPHIWLRRRSRRQSLTAVKFMMSVRGDRLCIATCRLLVAWIRGFDAGLRYRACESGSDRAFSGSPAGYGPNAQRGVRDAIVVPRRVPADVTAAMLGSYGERAGVMPEHSEFEECAAWPSPANEPLVRLPVKTAETRKGLIRECDARRQVRKANRFPNRRIDCITKRS